MSFGFDGQHFHRATDSQRETLPHGTEVSRIVPLQTVIGRDQTEALAIVETAVGMSAGSARLGGVRQFPCQLGDDVFMLLGQIGGFRGIALQIVKLRLVVGIGDIR